MRILSSSQLREADAFTISNEPIASIDLMERAANACVDEITSVFTDSYSVAVFCGMGNNGGDGLVIARRLHQNGWTVRVLLIHFSENQSEENKANENRLKQIGLPIHHVYQADELPDVYEDFIIDALVGTGLTRPLDGLLLKTVEHINFSSATCISIDIPSGMFSDEDNAGHCEKIVRAKWTLSFEAPKLSFMLADMRSFLGNWSILDIGLDDVFINSLESSYQVITRTYAHTLRKDRNPASHKGDFGRALVVAGSFGKMGAAILSTYATLRSGAGLVTAYIPKCGYTAMQGAIPEAMVICSDSENEISGEIAFSGFNALGIGPGIGTSVRTKAVLEQVLKQFKQPIVLDADALNLLAQHSGLLNSMPKNTILTPHVKEFDRIFGDQKSCHERLISQISASKKHNVFILLKGQFSSVSCPDGSVYFNTTGNPGMATGGTGDVLTGILTGLLAQGYSPVESCVLGCYLHGLAADIAVAESSEEAFIAGDIIEALGKAFDAL